MSMDRIKSPKRPRILVAGIGDICLGDDAFGSEASWHLTAHGMPPEVRVVDFGIRSLDLAHALHDGYEAAILIDATPRGEPAGTIYLLDLSAEAEWDEALQPGVGPIGRAHDLDPLEILRLAAAMGKMTPRIFLVGCEPSPTEDPEDMRDGLSRPVANALVEAVGLVESLVGRLLAREPIEVHGGLAPVARHGLAS